MKIELKLFATIAELCKMNLRHNIRDRENGKQAKNYVIQIMQTWEKMRCSIDFVVLLW